MQETLFMILFIAAVFITRYFFINSYGKRHILSKYEDFFVDENNDIFITIKGKKFLIFDKNITFRLKYIKLKTTAEELKAYFEETLLNRKTFVLTEIRNRNIFKVFNNSRTANIYIRDTMFDKIPTRLLPQTEFKNIVRELYELEIVDLVESDFKTISELISLSRFKKETVRKG